MGFGFRVGVPGMSVRVSTRGVRTSVGPRAARISVGSGGTRISSGLGPFYASSSLRGGGSRRGFSGANLHDSQALIPLVQGIPPIRSRRGPRRREPVKLHADKGYDYSHCPRRRWPSGGRSGSGARWPGSNSRSRHAR